MTHPHDAYESLLAALVDAGFAPYAAKIALEALRGAPMLRHLYGPGCDITRDAFLDQSDPGDETPDDEGFVTVHASGPCEGFGPRGDLESRN